MALSSCLHSHIDGTLKSYWDPHSLYADSEMMLCNNYRSAYVRRPFPQVVMMTTTTARTVVLALLNKSFWMLGKLQDKGPVQQGR